MNWQRLIAISIAAVIVTAALFLFDHLSKDPVVPQDASTLVLTGSGDVVLTPDPKGDLYDVNGGGTRRVKRALPVTVSAPLTYRFKGNVNIQVKEGEVIATIDNTTVVEPPNRQGTTFVVDDKGTVSIAGLLPRHYRVTGAAKLIANELVKATCVDCREIQVHGKADVVATGGESATVNMWGRLTSTGTKSVTVNDHGFASVTGADVVLVRGTSRAEATDCGKLTAQDKAKVKVSNCKEVDIQDAAEKVWFFILP